MTTKSEILEALYRGKNFGDCIRQVAPPDLADDLRQEIILRLCEQPDEKIIGLHQRGELEFYTVRIILNEFRNKTNGFARKYRTAHAELTEREIEESDDLTERSIREEMEDYTLAEIHNLYWYDSKMVQLYMEMGTFRAMQEKTGIPYVSCFKTVKKALIILRKKVNAGQVPKPVFNKEEMAMIAGKPNQAR